MKPNHAEICRVGNLEPDFQQVLFVIFSEIFTILLWNIINLNSERKVKNIFLDKISKKSLCYRNFIGQANFWP